MFQRLQQRMTKQKAIQESEPELLSFYPNAEDGMSLYKCCHNDFFKLKKFNFRTL